MLFDQLSQPRPRRLKLCFQTKFGAQHEDQERLNPILPRHHWSPLVGRDQKQPWSCRLRARRAAPWASARRVIKAGERVVILSVRARVARSTFRSVFWLNSLQMWLLGDAREGLRGDQGTQRSRGGRKGLVVNLGVGSCSFVWRQILLALRRP